MLAQIPIVVLNLNIQPNLRAAVDFPREVIIQQIHLADYFIKRYHVVLIVSVRLPIIITLSALKHLELGQCEIDNLIVILVSRAGNYDKGLLAGFE